MDLTPIAFFITALALKLGLRVIPPPLWQSVVILSIHNIYLYRCLNASIKYKNAFLP